MFVYYVVRHVAFLHHLFWAPESYGVSLDSRWTALSVDHSFSVNHSFCATRGLYGTYRPYIDPCRWRDGSRCFQASFVARLFAPSSPECSILDAPWRPECRTCCQRLTRGLGPCSPPTKVVFLTTLQQCFFVAMWIIISRPGPAIHTNSAVGGSFLVSKPCNFLDASIIEVAGRDSEVRMCHQAIRNKKRYLRGGFQRCSVQMVGIFPLAASHAVVCP